MTKLVFLGTASMVPTKERNTQSIYLEHEGEGILLDCGEGTQRQLTLAGLNAQKITTILLSHWHGDHVIGLLGLLQTLNSFASEEKKLRIYGPPGTKKYFSHMIASTFFELTLDVSLTELDAPALTRFYETEDYALEAHNLEHSTPVLGFRFVKKERRKILKKYLPKGLSGPLIGQLQQGEAISFAGETIQPDAVSQLLPAQSIAFVFDTQQCPACNELANNAELLICESSFSTEHADKAFEHKHMTAKQAGLLAKTAGVQHLVLTHFSQRYKDVALLLDEAKEEFSQTLLAEDFLEIEVDF